MINENSSVKQMSTIPSEINWRLRNWPDLRHFFRILPRIITMNHGTRSTAKSLELAGNEKSRLDQVAILFYASSIPPLATSATANPFLSRCPLSPPSIPPQKFVWKVGTAKWCFVVARKEDISSEEIGSFTLYPSTFQSPILHPVWFGFGKSEDEMTEVGAINQKS